MELTTILILLAIVLIGIFITIKFGVKILQIAFYIVGILAGLKYLGGL